MDLMKIVEKSKALRKYHSSSSIRFAPQYTVIVNFIKGIHRLCDRLLVSYENREVKYINDYYCISIHS